jgi:predicted RNase H-like nuclease (RuvC/YqgF family)
VNKLGLASKYLKEFDSVVTNIKSDISKLQKKQSQYDKRISEIYHKLETMKFNACEGYYISKELQDILRKRRLVKQELYRMNGICNTLPLDSFKKKLPMAKADLKKSNDLSKEWNDTFGFSFDDIEEEIIGR